jgi:hypothetical protein
MLIDFIIGIGVIFLMLIWGFCIPWLYRKIKDAQEAGRSPEKASAAKNP